MLAQTINGSAATAAVIAFFAITPAQAAMFTALHDSSPSVQRVDCAVGFHLGPAGACIIGTDDHRDADEHRATDEGCETKSVKRTDADGNSETRTKSNCN